MLFKAPIQYHSQILKKMISEQQKKLRKDHAKMLLDLLFSIVHFNSRCTLCLIFVDCVTFSANQISFYRDQIILRTKGQVHYIRVCEYNDMSI